MNHPGPAAPETAAPETLPHWTVRPGVAFPAWEHAGAPVARKALLAILEAFGIDKCWDGYGAEEDAVRIAVLRHLAATGAAPSPDALARATDIEPERLPALLDSLDRRDLLVLDADGAIAGAYPFSVAETGHRVRLGAVTLNAMCAIDALGTGAMFGADVAIASQCRACSGAVVLEVTHAGTLIPRMAPAETVVWSGLRYENGRAATSLCTVMAFFCSDAHLEAWRASEHPDVEGYRLSPEEARQVGAAIFAPMLRNVL